MMKYLDKRNTVYGIFAIQLVLLIGSQFDFLCLNLWSLPAFFIVNLLLGWIFWQLLSASEPSEDFEDEDQSYARLTSNKPTTFSPGPGTSSNGRSGILSSPVRPPEAAEKLWARWRRASGSQNPGTLGAQCLVRVDLLVNKGQRATDEEKNRSEWDWFEAVYDELRLKVQNERQAPESMRIFAEMASDFGYSLITASSGDDYNSARHQGVGAISARKMVVSQMLLPGLQENGFPIRSTALVTFRP